ncbi:potassium-transporting ATPase subunit KdpC [Clostridium uliginosum]|uniref:Potassium-transporting ATPase KdpC subunit n=1 Tax=Clostridium uliginosum TaxID=119641 RepID=A0A1I1L140_9CLOT|nr:potassium-transporting ATPase subunit KdpC [Clostridium uliginosum]SFC64123.1 K+-transporting ATPase ATPase C chain [Clostridium uliginosum]
MDDLKKGIKITIVFTVICGLIYPLFMTGIGQLLFPNQANGSVIKHNGKEVGSTLIGQQYNDDNHFTGRISAVDYNISEDGKEMDATSGSQNLATTSDVLKERVEGDIKTFLEKNPTVSKENISSELISQSGSGLDPDITPQGAKIQVDRVAKATGISEEDLKKLIDKNTKGKWLGLYGAERVNVLALNIAVDDITQNK